MTEAGAAGQDLPQGTDLLTVPLVGLLAFVVLLMLLGAAAYLSLSAAAALALVAVALCSILIVPAVGGGFLLLGCKIARVRPVSYGRCWRAYLAAYVCASLVCLPLAAVLPHDLTGPASLVPVSIVLAVALAVHALVIPRVLRATFLRTIFAQGTAILLTTSLLLILLTPAFLAARAAAQRTANQANLHLLGQAMFNYMEDHNQAFPPQAISSRDGKPLLSWRVALLPYLDQEPLYREFRLDEPWDSPHNRELLARMPSVFTLAGAPATDPQATYYQVFVSGFNTYPQAAYAQGWREGPRYQHFSDGMSSTILVAEAGAAVPWTKPEDLAYDPAKPVPPLGGASSARGFCVLFADGSVHFIMKTVPEEGVRALITANGNENINVDF